MATPPAQPGARPRVNGDIYIEDGSEGDGSARGPAGEAGVVNLRISSGAVARCDLCTCGAGGHVWGVGVCKGGWRPVGRSAPTTDFDAVAGGGKGVSSTPGRMTTTRWAARAPAPGDCFSSPCRWHQVCLSPPPPARCASLLGLVPAALACRARPSQLPPFLPLSRSRHAPATPPPSWEPRRGRGHGGGLAP